MKKLLVFTVCILLIGCATTKNTANTANTAKNKEPATNSLNYIISGEYAFYLDTRGGMNFFRGYMYYKINSGTNAIFVRSLNLDNGNEERFIFEVDDDKNGHPTNIKNMRGQLKSNEARQALPDFFNFTTLYLDTRDDYDVQKLVDDDWETYTLVFNFNKVLPFFRFLDIKMKGSDKSTYTLQYGGFLSGDRALQFFEMKPIVREKETARRIPVIPKKAEKTVKSNDISITLDENWSYNNSTELPGYWLALDSIRDSQISIEKSVIQQLDPNNPEDTLRFMKALILKCSNAIEMNTVKVEKTLNGYQLEYYVWENGVKNYQRAIIVPMNTMYYIINFSSFADIYDKNKTYYENILNSILITKL